MPLNKFILHHYYIPYCTLHSRFKVKCPVSGAKTRVKFVTLARIFYIDIGMFGCVCITLLQVGLRIAVVHNSNIGGVSLNVNGVSCWKYPLHETKLKPN